MAIPLSLLIIHYVSRQLTKMFRKTKKSGVESKRLLGDTQTDRTLEQTVTFIAQKEQGKATRNVVGDKAGAMGPKPGPSKPSSATLGKCWACGGPRHAQKNDRTARENNCKTNMTLPVRITGSCFQFVSGLPLY